MDGEGRAPKRGGGGGGALRIAEIIDHPGDLAGAVGNDLQELGLFLGYRIREILQQKIGELADDGERRANVVAEGVDERGDRTAGVTLPVIPPVGYGRGRAGRVGAQLVEQRIGNDVQHPVSRSRSPSTRILRVEP